MLEPIFDVLNSRALGNVALLLAAVIGIGGNLYLYWYKRDKRRTKLRRALYAEIHSMEPVVRAMERQHDAITMDPIDPRSFLVDSVYQSSSEDLGLLTGEEVSAVVEFYSTAISIQRVVGEDYHVAYEQVDRRDLLFKLETAASLLKKFGEFDSESLESIEVGEWHDESSDHDSQLKDTST